MSYRKRTALDTISYLVTNTPEGTDNCSDKWILLNKQPDNVLQMDNKNETGDIHNLSRDMTKHKVTVRPAKTQISRGIRPV